ncbi:BZ3500_MvSof-1268-A1-R1_Chr2-1g04254 [Microbotryum saponariae]|uniref:BZ3500_MvSof-1268-A1-R1_Chr2-1g04254 protein n=1 Tax=Microbotryum saponariae TaxID=289078 RepID=A0A2X0K6W0_9BASI|nr:BZ3500_MvSof-1268-A1-R1_Chr2-1g04254 [Microbotryum saponariae]SCZ91241.1 BZ3501_MvSof-1269-A2-R1_Chr2-1g03910 [Microbotryum saponariae]
MPSSRVRQPSAKARAAAGEASLWSGPVVSTPKATASMATSTGSRSRTVTTSATSSYSAAAATRKSARGRGKGSDTAATGEDEHVLNNGHPDDDDDEEHKDDAASDDEEPHGMHADANENEDDDDQDDAYDDHMGMSNSKEPDFTLYCICLGLAGEQPMIQCDHCSNWCVADGPPTPLVAPLCQTVCLLPEYVMPRFHFSCVGIDDDTAAMIESYCCDICAGMGKGVTLLSGASMKRCRVAQAPLAMVVSWKVKNQSWSHLERPHIPFAALTAG